MYSVSLGSLNGYNSSVQLSVSGLPARTTASFSPSRLTPSGTSSLSLHAGSTAKRGTYTLTITGAGSDGTRRATTVMLTIN
jgi:aminopeptidase S